VIENVVNANNETQNENEQIYKLQDHDLYTKLFDNITTTEKIAVVKPVKNHEFINFGNSIIGLKVYLLGNLSLNVPRNKLMRRRVYLCLILDVGRVVIC